MGAKFIETAQSGRAAAMLIRDEVPGDAEAIHDLTERAFAPMRFSNGTEAGIIRRLRQAGDMILSLVAEEKGQIIGHVAFSAVTIDGRQCGWFGLGPISVEPTRQRQGIGKALIAEGLAQLRQKDAEGCALIGNADVYRSSGFSSDGRLTYGDLDSRYVLSLAFSGGAPQGALGFAPAFQDEGKA
jgi:putative acetyltransferase